MISDVRTCVLCGQESAQFRKTSTTIKTGGKFSTTSNVVAYRATVHVLTKTAQKRPENRLQSYLGKIQVSLGKSCFKTSNSDRVVSTTKVFNLRFATQFTHTKLCIL